MNISFAAESSGSGMVGSKRTRLGVYEPMRLQSQLAGGHAKSKALQAVANKTSLEGKFLRSE
jgi:hypothetical protein